MAEITLTIKGEPHEIQDAIKQLFTQLSPTSHSDSLAEVQHSSSVVADEGASGGGWEPADTLLTSEELRHLWGEVSDGAKRVLAYVASNYSGCSLAELMEKFSLDGRAIGGSLSSVGSALRRAGISQERQPFKRETKGGELFYSMNAVVAHTILGLMREDDLQEEVRNLVARRKELMGRREAIVGITKDGQIIDIDVEELGVELEQIQAELLRVESLTEYAEAELFG